MPKQAASAPSTATAAKAPGKKRSRAVGKGAAVGAAAATEPVVVETRRAPSHGEIAECAYTLYAARGFRDGDSVQDWLSAEQQLRRS